MLPSSTARRRAVLAAAAAALAITTSACRVDLSVGIDADDDGGGEVRAQARLDGSAVTQLGGPQPGDRIRLDDLRKAGWKVEGPTPQDDGGLEIVATHPFESPAEAEALLEDLGGGAGPLRGFSLTQRRSFLKTTTEFEGTVDLQAGLGAFTDPDLQTALGATPEAPLGVTSEALEKRLGETIEGMLGLQLAVRLPGAVTANAPTENGDGAVWAPPLGDDTAIEATAEQWNVANIAGAATATVSGLALATLALARTRRRNLTVTDGNITVEDHGETGTDGRGTARPEG